MVQDRFELFPSLPFECRALIWERAIQLEIQLTQERMPRFVLGAYASRRKDTIMGPRPGQEKPPLEFQLRDPYHGEKMQIEEDEYKALVNCFYLSSVCSEARAFVHQACLPLVTHMLFKYTASPIWSLDSPSDTDRGTLLRSRHCVHGAERLKHFYSQPLVLNISWYGVALASDLTKLISRFFAGRIQRIILEVAIHDTRIEKGFWPVIESIPSRVTTRGDRGAKHITYSMNGGQEDAVPFFWQHLDKKNIESSNNAGICSSAIAIDHESALEVGAEFWHNELLGIHEMTEMLFKMYDFYSACIKAGLDPRHIDIRVNSTGMSGSQSTSIATTWQRRREQVKPHFLL